MGTLPFPALIGLTLLAGTAVLGACGGAEVTNANAGNGNGSSDGGNGAGNGAGAGISVGGAAGAGTSGGSAGVAECASTTTKQELKAGPLDIYLMFDRTASMGADCAYVAGTSPPVTSKACFATYAMNDYLINVKPLAETRLAFQFMSQPGESCDGAAYAKPLVPLTKLPLTADSTLVRAISDEDFKGGFGTEIEGALNGLAQFTAANRTSGREMIGVLLTDGDPQGCSGNVDALAKIVADHYAATKVRTFVVGMQGATLSNLETIAAAGGAEPHTDFCGGASSCHYWSVANGSGNAIESALRAIIAQSMPLPCDYDITGLEAPPGQRVDFGKVNVKLTDEKGTATFIGQTTGAAACPSSEAAWYYDDAKAPKRVMLCPRACTDVKRVADGSRMDIVLGCQDTITIR